MPLPETIPFGMQTLINELEREVIRAIRKHPPMNGPHEGWAVIKEELDELWKHVMEDTGRGAEARKEALQVAAMGLRYAYDVTVDGA